MKEYLTILLIGLVSGFTGILPLLRKKADKYSLLAAFLLFFILPYLIFHIHLPWTKWWWKGMAVAGVLALPLAITSGRGCSRCAFPLLLSAIAVGAFISFLGHYLLNG